MKKFLLGLTSAALLASCGSSDHGELVGVQDRPTWYPSEPYGMVYIPQGSFTMGNHDEDVPYAYTAPAKVVSIASFYMDQTEITNNEYRQFVHWVRDSIARVRLAEGFVEDFAVEGGSSAGAYITKPVNLANASTALDIRVAASVRSSSSIKCFFRTTGGEETRKIDDIEYTPFNTDGSPDTTVAPSTGDQVQDIDFKDYKFSVSSLPEFSSFQIKIVFRGTNSAYTARIKDFRGIALAV